VPHHMHDDDDDDHMHAGCCLAGDPGMHTTALHTLRVSSNTLQAPQVASVMLCSLTGVPSLVFGLRPLQAACARAV
jgi:hypothetical protein